MKKLLSFAAIVMALLILIAGSILLYRLQQFRAAVNHLQADGYPVSISDLTQPAANYGQQASHLFNRLAAPLSSFEKEMWVDNEALDRPVDDDMIARFDELQKAYPNVFPLIDKLSKETTIALDLEGDHDTFLESVIERMTRLRSCARVLAWKVRILAAQGKPDEAIAAGLEIFQLCRLFDQYPMIISQLVVNACRGIGIGAIHEVIANHTISDPTRELLNRELELQDVMPGCAQCLVGERAFGIEAISEIGTVQMALAGNRYLDLLGDEIKNSAKQPFERQQSVDGRDSEWTSGWTNGYSAGLFTAFEQFRTGIARTRSNLRSLRIINALQARPNAEADTITQDYLVEIGVPQSMTVDTMNGELMKIKRDENRWIVYSVGPDREDDGGNPIAMEDYVVGVKDEE